MHEAVVRRMLPPLQRQLHITLLFGRRADHFSSESPTENSSRCPRLDTSELGHINTRNA
jgi:hypothetical protein